MRKTYFIIFIIILVGFFIALAFLNNKNIISRIEDVKRPRPIDSFTVPLPPSQNKTALPHEVIQERIMQRERVIEAMHAMPNSDGGKFAQSCVQQGGGVLVDVNASTVIYECYLVSSDAGKNCRTDVECGSYNCNFQIAIDSGVCVLIKTDKYFVNQTYFYSYHCSTPSPGICGEIPKNMPEYYWIGDTVLEYGEKIFPNEQNEFHPV